MTNTTMKNSTAGASSRTAPSARLSPMARTLRQPARAGGAVNASATAMAASAEIVKTAVASQLRQDAPQANAAWPGSGDHRDHRGTRSGTPTGNFADHAKLRYLVSSKRHA